MIKWSSMANAVYLCPPPFAYASKSYTYNTSRLLMPANWIFTFDESVSSVRFGKLVAIANESGDWGWQNTYKCKCFNSSVRRKRRSNRKPFGKTNSNVMASLSFGSGSDGISSTRSIFCRAISCNNKNHSNFTTCLQMARGCKWV